MDPDETLPCLPPVVELDERDLDEGPWAGFADEVRGLVTEEDYRACGLSRPLPPPTTSPYAPGCE